ERLEDPSYDRLGRRVALTDGRVERGDVGGVEVAGDGRERLVREDPLRGKALTAHQPSQALLAPLDRFLAAFLGEVLLDLVARPRALDEGQPVPAGGGVGGLRREHLDDVAVVERGLEGDQPSVDPGTDATVPDL